MLLILLAAVLTVSAAGQAALPTLSFDNLNKTRLTLPTDFHADRNLLLLYFDLSQQADIDAWNTDIDRWRAHDPGLTAYTSLVSSQKNLLSRWWQNSSLRSASPDASRRATTVPLYVDKRAFDRKLSIASEKQITVLLLDRQGRVLARAIGPPTAASRGALFNALRAAGSPLAVATAAP